MKKQGISYYFPYALIAFFLLIYLMFPNRNSGIDAYNYAANIRWGHDLFFPHHLLYNFFHYLLIKTIHFFGFFPDILSWMKSVNAVFAALSLYILHLILIQSDKTGIIHTKSAKHAAFLLFAGSCFGFMRYATENETYIIPIFWSLLASYFFLKYLQNESNKHLILSGLMASMACLFHQIHIFWYAGLFIGLIIYQKKLSQLILLIAPALIMPVIYYLAFRQNHSEFIHAQNLWQFVLYDYYYGTAHARIGFHNLVLGFISFVRSFVQVHGNIGLILTKNNFIWLSLVSSLGFFLIALSKFLKNKPSGQKPDTFSKIHLIIFILQFSFAVFSEGNAEFMVMLPMLFILIIHGRWNFHPPIFVFSAMAILIWNFSFGILPNKIVDFQNHVSTLNFVESRPETHFILSDDVQIQNMNYYKTGILWNPNIYKSPASILKLGKDTSELCLQIDSLLHSEKQIYTDCIKEPRILSRKTFLQKADNSLFFKRYRVELTDSAESFSGTRYFYRIKGKMN